MPAARSARSHDDWRAVRLFRQQACRSADDSGQRAKHRGGDAGSRLDHARPLLDPRRSAGRSAGGRGGKLAGARPLGRPAVSDRPGAADRHRVHHHRYRLFRPRHPLAACLHRSGSAGERRVGLHRRAAYANLCGARPGGGGRVVHLTRAAGRHRRVPAAAALRGPACAATSTGRPSSRSTTR